MAHIKYSTRPEGFNEAMMKEYKENLVISPPGKSHYEIDFYDLKEGGSVLVISYNKKSIVTITHPDPDQIPRIAQGIEKKIEYELNELAQKTNQEAINPPGVLGRGVGGFL